MGDDEGGDLSGEAEVLAHHRAGLVDPDWEVRPCVGEAAHREGGKDGTNDGFGGGGGDGGEPEVLNEAEGTEVQQFADGVFV